MWFLALGPADSVGDLLGREFLQTVLQTTAEVQIFTKYSETETAIQLSAPSENMYPIHIKGLYLYLDISMVIFPDPVISGPNYL